MAKRRKYSSDDKGVILAALEINSGNVKRTARDTGVPEQTVRDLKKKYELEPVPQEVVEAADEEKDAFVEKAVVLRDKAMEVLYDKLDKGDVKAGELNAIIGTLTDKIRFANQQPNQRSETAGGQLTPRELGEAILGFVEGALRAANDRAAEISVVDVEQAREALPPPRS